MIYLGIDPDITNISIAALNDDNKLKVYFNRCKHTKNDSQENKIKKTAILIDYCINKAIYDIYIHCNPEIFCMIECQSIMQTTTKSQGDVKKLLNIAQSIIGTATLSGVFLNALIAQKNIMSPRILRMPEEVLIDPELILPQAWKGSLPKHVTQTRAFAALGIPYELKGGKNKYAVPEDWDGFLTCVHKDSDKPNKGDMIDIADSIALALHCKKKYSKI
ncbi:MAG: hypothetical protein GY845_25885 [Planctomycetes bacterium]|nr:hypothetical protein [Planctomycetota bacterium]